MPAVRLLYVSRSICPDQYVIAIAEYIVEAVARPSAIRRSAAAATPQDVTTSPHEAV